MWHSGYMSEKEFKERVRQEYFKVMIWNIGMELMKYYQPYQVEPMPGEEGEVWEWGFNVFGRDELPKIAEDVFTIATQALTRDKGIYQIRRYFYNHMSKKEIPDGKDQQTDTKKD